MSKYVPIKLRPGYAECMDKIRMAHAAGKAKGAEGRRLVSIIDQTCPWKNDIWRPLWLSARRSFLKLHGFPIHKRVKRDPNQMDLIDLVKSGEPESTIYKD